VLYQSSEDPDLRYKDYVEDVLLGLGLAGALLVPSYVHFRAHHNKVFMEILRDTSGFEAIQSIQSRVYGTCEELKAQTNSVVYPAVIKPGAGSRSYGVQLCVDQDSLLRVARLISRSFKERYRVGVLYFQFPNGDNTPEFVREIEAFVSEILSHGVSRTCPKCIIIFTHGFALRVIAKAFLGISDEEFRYLRNPPNCYVASLTIKEGTPSIDEPLPRVSFDT